MRRTVREIEVNTTIQIIRSRLSFTEYIHVVVLAEGHGVALKRTKSGVNIYNLGTGRGFSVLELVKAFERANLIKVPYKLTQRRAGDVAVTFAGVGKAKVELDWDARLTVEDMVRDSWNFAINK